MHYLATDLNKLYNKDRVLQVPQVVNQVQAMVNSQEESQEVNQDLFINKG